MRPEIVTTGLRTPEGPCWRAATSELLVTSVAEGTVHVIDTRSGSRRLLADTGGGPNGAVLCADGGALITQNGGLDWSSLAGVPAFADPPATRFVTSCVQRIGPDGAVSSWVGPGLGLRAPNDIAVTFDNVVVFTDPVRFDLGTGGKVVKVVDGEATILDSFDHYLNGVSLAPDGRVCTAEHTGLRWLGLGPGLDGERDWFVEELPDGAHVDGFAFDANGWAYACSPGIGMFVYDSDGRLQERFELPDGAVTLNCCFGGADLRTLFVTDAGNRTVLAFEGMPAPGFVLPLART